MAVLLSVMIHYVNNGFTPFGKFLNIADKNL